METELAEKRTDGRRDCSGQLFGADNSQLCAALAQLDPDRFAGVAVVPLGVSDDELARRKRAGVRGVRWNLIRGVQIPDIKSDKIQAFFEKLRANGLHLDIQLEGPRLALILQILTNQGVNVAIDHFGLPSEPDRKNDPLL